MNYVVTGSMPKGWGFTFAPNHFYFEVKDPDGNVLRVNAAQLFIGYCTQCERKITVSERPPDTGCPYCLTRTVIWQDGTTIGFLPSAPSDFKAPPQRALLADAGALSDAPSEGAVVDKPDGSSER